MLFRSNWMFFRRIIDATLNMCCDRVRCRFVPRLTVNNGFEKNNETVDYFNPFTFESFNYRATRNPNESDEDYLKWLNMDKTTRKQKLSILQKYMAELISGGWEIICIRLPISGSIKRLEEQNFDCSAFKTLCDNLKIIFFDYSEENYNTYDGSHLDAYEAERFSRRLAMDLQTKINWEKKVVFKSPR